MGQLTINGVTMQFDDIVVGTGPEATNTSVALVTYTAKKDDGSGPTDILGAAVDTPVEIPLVDFEGILIEGFRQGVIGMKTGGIRRLTIPPALAYGSTTAPPHVTVDDTLIFEVTLQEVRKAPIVLKRPFS